MKIQLSPFGEFPQTTKDGDRIVQICDEKAFRDVVANFKGPVLLDYKHKRGKAAGWFTSVSLESDGLYGELDPTESGGAAIRSKEFRFVSPDWDLAADDRPIRLRTVGLTNTPNIPVRPITNSKHFTDTKPKTKTNMKEILQALGLAEDASEADALAALTALINRATSAENQCKEAEATRLQNEAVAFAEANKNRIQNSEAFIESYKKDPEGTKALVGTLKPEAEPAKRVTNSAMATYDPAGGALTAKQAAEYWAGLPPREANAYYAANQALVDRGLSNM